ncbi:efflux RND transporter periplasmic adaptor subunit [Syntrophobotulus glycolicus]|nr:efflux RND transporter periplasmic adaptor subunit [Syntrophobotulus glycolicus]
MLNQKISDLGTGKEMKTSRSLKKKILVIGLILLVLLIVGLNVYRFYYKDVIPVAVSPVSEKNLVEKVPASGNVVAADREIVYSQASGTVENIHVKMGQKVTAGQALLDIDIIDAEQKLAEARAKLAAANLAFSQARSGDQTTALISARSALTEAENTYKQDKDHLERTRILVEQGAVAQVDLDKAQADLNNSQAAYDQAQANFRQAEQNAPLQLQSLQANVESAGLQLEAIEKQVAGRNLLSPCDGYVLSIAVNTGDQIDDKTQLLTIGNVAKLNIEADIPESGVGKIKNGQAVSISCNAFPEEKFQGKVTQVGLEMVTKTKNNQQDTFLPVMVEVEGDSRLLPGFKTDLEIVTADIQTLVVPIEALVEKNEGKSLFVLKEGIAHLTVVKTGINDGVTVEILSGVNKDEQVILNPSAKVQDGSKVRVQ